MSKALVLLTTFIRAYSPPLPGNPNQKTEVGNLVAS